MDDDSGEAAARPVLEQAASLLARSLFEDTSRNRRVMLHWLSRPIDHSRVSRAPARNHAAVEHERQRARAEAQRARLQKRQRTEPASARALARDDRATLLRALVPAATATLHRRIPRSTQNLIDAATAMSQEQTYSGTASAAQSLGPVATLAELVLVLLLEPIRLVLVAGGKGSSTLQLMLFGAHTLRHLHVPSAVLTRDECSALEYIALMAGYWIADDDAADEVLVAGPLLNDAFELSLDRVALVWALCETIIYGAGTHERVRHALEAALLMCAGRESVIRAGYYNSVRELAASVRAVPLVSTTTPELVHAAAFAAREYAARYAIETIDFRDWRRAHRFHW
jgi:hypothetical protein